MDEPRHGRPAPWQQEPQPPHPQQQPAPPPAPWAGQVPGPAPTQQWTPQQQWAPNPRPTKPAGLSVGRKVAIALSYVGVLILGIAIGTSGSSNNTSDETASLADSSETGSNTEAAAAQTEDPAPAEPANISFESTCEYLLDFDNGHSFVATVFLENDNQVEVPAVITAIWRQSGAKAVTQRKKVTIPAGASDFEVQFNKRASDAQIDRIQALPEDKQCKVDGEAQ